jgi:hypothetical protein
MLAAFPSLVLHLSLLVAGRTFMTPYLLGVSTFLLILAATKPQTSANCDQVPTVCIALPKEIKSDTVQIRYLMSGPFGGYASYVDPKPDLRSYRINAAVQGKAAQSIRILFYASGCRFQTLVLAFSGNENLEEQFVCQPLPTIKLKGQIPAELSEIENAELVAIYTAYWAQGFFGIMDGFVTQLQVARAKPDADGFFEIEISDFAADVHASSFEPSASLSLGLRDSKTLNPIALNLEPELSEFRTQTNALRIQPTYPMGMRFLPSNGIKGKVFRSDSHEAISNSYILLEHARKEHFDVRTNEKGEYLFGDIPPGNYTVSIYGWFPNKLDVPCQNPLEAKTVDGGKVTVEWQGKSHAFMEIVTLKEFSVESGQKIKDFDLFCK